jgi:type II secretory pathway pseudopilin PulG
MQLERKEMKLRASRGFSMIEMVIILAIIVGLAGVVVPIVSQEVQDSKKGNAVADLNRIATALNQYIKDTLYFPTGNMGSTSFHFLHTDGNLPVENVFDSGDHCHVDRFLASSEFGGARWRGPYLQSGFCDPWGGAYIINVQGFFNPGERAMILSAGPDGLLATPPTALSPEGDDLMLLID